jgi:hypothetical protein
MAQKNYFRHFQFPDQTARLEQRVEKILQSKDYEAIDKIVYDLYKLSPEGIEFIETR